MSFFFVFWVVRIKYVLVFSYFEFFDSKYLYFLKKQFFFEILFFFSAFSFSKHPHENHHCHL